ncbi:hypothetical protein EDD86DRAFT_216791 [Gorgonomyces haynaldii]|nr:hypothetical protein EDD86DRAFT_216791 [Gorgonomyces haynaldii]
MCDEFFPRMKTRQLVIDKNDLKKTFVEQRDLPPLVDNQILLEIDRLAVTANNATYVALGNTYQYWDFFPSGNPKFGVMPCWGFATVVDSKSQIQKGERIFGYFPTATHCIFDVDVLHQTNFIVRRPQLPRDRIVYHNYVRCKYDPSYKKENESLCALFWPLWATSYFVVDCLQENAFFGAKQVIVTSASSKTAFCAAFCLQHKIKCIGLTSKGNIPFVEKLGLYDQVIGYDQLDKLDKQDTVVVDVAGDAKLLKRLEDLLGDKFKKAALVGISHFGAAPIAKPGDKSFSFFAPEQKSKLSEIQADESKLVQELSAFMNLVTAYTACQDKRLSQAIKIKMQDIKQVEQTLMVYDLKIEESTAIVE